MIKKICLMTRGGKEVVGRRVVVTSEFEANRENIWCKIQDIDTLREICKPKASFVSYDNTSPTWKEGKSFCFKMFLHRFIPVGKHTINVVKMDKSTGEIVTNEYNAGGLTALAAWWTLKFYKHRQKKWQKIAKNL